MQNKELRMQENKMKREQDLAKQREAKKKAAKEKADKIKEAESRREEARLAEKEEMKKKYEGNLSKFREEMEEKEQIRRENKQLLLERQKRAKSKRSQLKEQENEDCLNLLDKIEETMRKTEENFQNKISKTITNIKYKLDKDWEIYQRHKEDLKKEDEEKFNNLMKKLEQRNIHFETINEMKIKRENEFRKLKEKKEKKLQEMRDRLKEKDQDRMEEYHEKIKQVDMIMEKKKQQEREHWLIMQELRKMQEEDNVEKFERNKRRDQFRLQKIIGKKKVVQEKLKMRKTEQNFRNNIQQLVEVHSKIEKERINQSLKKFSNALTLNIMGKSTDDLKKSISQMRTIIGNEPLLDEFIKKPEVPPEEEQNNM